MSSSSGIGSFWCYRCSRFVRVFPRGNTSPISCPDCSGGFLEELSTPPRLAAAAAEHRRRRFPSPRASSSGPIVADAAHRRNRRGSAGDRSPFNPVIVLRGASEGMEPDRSNTSNSFELYYDDGAGSGLRPLPSTVSDFLMGSGFDRLLGQLAQIGTNGVGGVRTCDHSPASKGAIESMPMISIDTVHIGMDSYCAVCKEKFELGTKAREMPCKHIYHQDCILPWLLLRNSCPVCRHKLPTNAGRRILEFENDDESVGLTIWRLPGGGFAVGRFAGGRRPGERELPMVYTEMDGSFNAGGAPRRILWSARGNRSRESGGFIRTLRNMLSFRCFGGSPSLSASSAGASTSRSVSRSSSRRILWSARGNRSRESGGFIRTLRNMFSFRCFGSSPSLSTSSAGASTSRSVSRSSTRRILWSARGNRSRESGGFIRTLRNMFSFRCFGCSPSLSTSSAGASTSRLVSTSSARLSWRAPTLRRSRGSRRDGNSRALEEGSGNSISRW